MNNENKIFEIFVKPGHAGPAFADVKTVVVEAETIEAAISSAILHYCINNKNDVDHVEELSREEYNKRINS